MIEGFDSMTLCERRDALWGLRDSSAAHMNRIRREMFETVKDVLPDRSEAKPVKPPPAVSLVLWLPTKAVSL